MFNPKMIRPGFVCIFFFVLASGCAHGPVGTRTVEQATVEGFSVNRGQHMIYPPTADVASKKIFITFDQSPKATTIIQDNLRSRGFIVVESENEAEEKYYLSGTYNIGRINEKNKYGKLGPLLESSIEIDASGKPKQSIGAFDVLSSGTVFGFSSFISISNMANALSQLVGFTGWLNKMIAGDPRGFCHHKDCNIYRSTVNVYVNNEKGTTMWIAGSDASDTKILLDILISDAIEYAMKPIYDLKPLSTKEEGNEGGEKKSP